MQSIIPSARSGLPPRLVEKANGRDAPGPLLPGHFRGPRAPLRQPSRARRLPRVTAPRREYAIIDSESDAD